MPYQILCNGAWQKSPEARTGLGLTLSLCASLHKNRYGIIISVITRARKQVRRQEYLNQMIENMLSLHREAFRRAIRLFLSRFPLLLSTGNAEEPFFGMASKN